MINVNSLEIIETVNQVAVKISAVESPLADIKTCPLRYTRFTDFRALLKLQPTKHLAIFIKARYALPPIALRFMRHKPS